MEVNGAPLSPSPFLLSLGFVIPKRPIGCNILLMADLARNRHSDLAGSSALGALDQIQVLDSKSLRLLPAMGTAWGEGTKP